MSALQQTASARQNANLGPPDQRRRSLLARQIAAICLASSMGTSAIGQLAYAQDAPFEVPFDVTVQLSWSEYEISTKTLSVKADDNPLFDYIGSCTETKEKQSSINIPFIQNVFLNYSQSGKCKIAYAKYQQEGHDWVTFRGTQILHNYQGEIKLYVRAKNDRDDGFFDLKCQSCTVTAVASFSGGVPTSKQQNYTRSYAISSAQITPEKVGTISMPVTENTVAQDAKCEIVNVAHDDVQVSCKKVGEGFVLYANIDNEAPTVSNPTPATDTVLEERADVTLTWTGSDPENDPLHYNVYFGGELVCDDITTTTCTVPVDKLDFGTEYLWYVEAKDEYQTTTGDVWSFSIRDNLPPTAPTYLSPPSPANGLENVETTEASTFEWNASTDPDNDEITYQLCRQKTGGDTVCNPEQSETSKTLPAETLEYGTDYEWFVVAKDSYGNSTFGETWSFKTIPAPVNLLMTADSGRSNTKLKWSITNDADVAHYRILRAREGEAFTPDKEITIVDTPADFFYDEDALEAGAKYCYRIEALDADKTALHQSNSSCVTAGVTKLAMKDSGGSQGTEVDVPIILPNAGGLQIGSSDIWLGYDPRVINVTGVKKEGSVLDVEDMEYTVDYNIEPEAEDFHIVKISVSDSNFTSPPLEGEGPLVYVTFDVIGEAFSSSPLKLIPFEPGRGGSTMQDHNFEDIPLAFEDRSFTVQTRRKTRDGKQQPHFYVGVEYGPGDINGNAALQTVDARMAEFIGVGKLVANAKQRTAGDVNEDNMVDSADAYKIKYRVLHAEWPGSQSTQTRRRVIRDGNRDTPILLSLEEISAVSGSEVTSTLSIDNLVKTSAMNLTMVYDPQVIEKVTKVSKADLATGTDLVFHDDGNGILRIGISTQTPISGNGALVTLTLQLASGGNVKSTPLSLAQAHLYNRAGHDFAITLRRDIQASHGKVTLTDVEEIPVIKDDGVVTSLKDLESNPISDSEPVDSGPVYTASGTIIGEDGNPIAGITVQIKDKTAITDAEGKWSIADLVSNHYLLTATGENYAFTPQVIAIKDANVVVEVIGNPILEPVYTASGQLLDDFGEPIVNATIEVDGKIGTTDKNGIWEITGLPKGTYTVSVLNMNEEDYHQFASQKFTIIDSDRTIELSTDGPYHAESTITDDAGNPIAGVTIQMGDRTAVTDAQGYWRIDGLFENESETYPVIASKPGYIFEAQECGVGPGQQCVVHFSPESELEIRVSTEPNQVIEGSEVTYDIKVVNLGDATATGVKLALVMLEGANFVSINPMDGGSCSAETMTCSLPNLKSTEFASVQVVMTSIDANRMVNRIIAKSNEYPDNVKMSWKDVKPYLFMSISGKPNPVVMGETIHYQINVELNQYAPTSATGVKLAMTLSDGVTLESINSDYGACQINTQSTLSCLLTDLSIDSPNSLSHVTVDMAVNIKDAGLLVSILEAKVTANEFPAYVARKRTQIFIPLEYQVDIALVIDVTGSMQEEINGVKQALKKFVKEVSAEQFPLTALVVFRDEVTVKAVTVDMNTLIKSIEKMEASGGGACTEASVEALDKAIAHVKPDGIIFFVTDASPYKDADVTGTMERLRAKSIQLNAMITGDCANRESWNFPE